MRYAHTIAASLLVAQTALAQSAPKPVAVIGGDRGGRIELENPSDILTVGNRIVVLDANEPFLKVFDFDGKAIQATVKKGSGPGEISSARRFTVDSATGRVYVIDVMNLRANVYALRDTLTYETSFALPGNMEDLCVVGTRLYTMGTFGNHLLHEFEPKTGRLELVRSFGVARGNPELDANPMFQHQVSIGRLGCDVGRNRIVAVSGYTGAAQEIDLRTLEQRTIKLDGLIPLWFKEQDFRGKRGLAQGAPPGGFDWVRRAHVTGEGVRFLADHYDATRQGNEDFVSVSEWFVLPNGTLRKGVVTRQREVGRNGNRIACFVGSPLPTIEIFQAARCP